MLKGLEISIVNLTDIYLNKDFRTDTDFWTKQPILNLKLRYDKIGNCLEFAQYGISIDMNEVGKGYPIYRMNEIHNMLCDFEVNKHADISQSELETFKLKDGDVLFNRTNSYEWVGRTGIYKKIDNRDFIFASYLVRFVPNKKIILPEYLASFLSSKYGIWDIKRRARQSINQTNVNPEEVKQIDIPLLSIVFQEKIKSNFDTSINLLIKSQNFYTHAETILLKEIGLQNFTPSKEPVNIKSFKESFGVTGRLDAEYYQTKYEDYLNLIYNYKNGYEKISKICELKDSNFSPELIEKYKYIELSNIGKTGEVNGCTEEFGKDLPTRARRIVYSGDVIISSIEGSLQSCAIIQNEFNKALCSTGFYVVKSDSINSESLLVLFKSELLQAIMKQNCSGTILTGMNKDEFSKIPIPILDSKKQIKIAELIKESFILITESERLLDVAKKAVEMAIEEGEDKAMEYIKVNENGN